MIRPDDPMLFGATVDVDLDHYLVHSAALIEAHDRGEHTHACRWVGSDCAGRVFSVGWLDEEPDWHLCQAHVDRARARGHLRRSTLRDERVSGCARCHAETPPPIRW